MTAPAAPVAAVPSDPLARPMFAVATLYLVFLAGLVHRVKEMSPAEWRAWQIGIAVLWPMLIAEGGYRFLRRGPGVSRRRAAFHWLLVAVLPPFRLGLPS